MIVTVRNFCFIFLLFIIINIVINVLNLHQEITRKKGGSLKYKYGRPVYVNISQNWNILYDLIIYNKNDVRDVRGALKNKATGNVNTIKSDFSSQYNYNSDKETLEPCPLVAPDLGPVADDKAISSLLGIDDMYLWVQPGGIYIPTECLALQQVAIIVPMHETPRLQYNFNSGIKKEKLKPCPFLAPNLGPVANDKTISTLFGIDKIYLQTQPGGIHIPTECLAIQQVAIIVTIHETPRTKIDYITSFLYYIHPFLMKQQLEYQIFVILKPNATVPYKRGELFNIGFKEALAYRPEGWNCIIFHDAHLIPMDTRNLYRCSQNPKLLIAGIQKPHKFGGAVAVRPRHFVKANGFSNHVWSNDTDYVDMYKRLIASNLTVQSNTSPIGNYFYFDTLRQENNEPETSQTDPPNYLKDGLSTVSYNIKNCMRLKQFYTLIEVEI